MSIKLTHSPAPWTLKRAGNQIRIMSGLYCVAIIEVFDASAPHDQDAINAALMAASPELLELLQEAREYGKTETAWKIWERRADKAIKKAGGKI